MKRIVCLILVMLFSSYCFAGPSVEVLKANRDILYQLSFFIQQMIAYNNTAIEGKIKVIDLTAEQKDQLINEYYNIADQVPPLWNEVLKRP